jgi:hypothetical protein
VFVKSRLVRERAYLVHARKVDLEPLQGTSKTYFLGRSNGYYSSFTYFASKVWLRLLMIAFHILNFIQDPLRYTASPSCPANDVRWHRLRPRWPCTHRSRLLEIYAHSRSIQLDYSKCCSVALNCFCQRKRGQSRWNPDYVVQVCFNEL